MSCCATSRTAPLSKDHRIRLRYGGGRPVIVKGPATGESYRFSGVDREQLVDPRDAVSFVADRHFQVVGVVDVATS